MNNEVITPLEKNRIRSNEIPESSKDAACCGGAPVQDAEACCKLDEQKKAEGDSGCGCNAAKAAPEEKCC